MLHLLGGMARQLGRPWGLLEDVMSGAEVSCFPNLPGPTLNGGRMLTPDWLPTGLGSAVGKDKVPTCGLHVTLHWAVPRNPLVILGARQCQTPWKSDLVPDLRHKPPEIPHPAPLPSTLHPLHSPLCPASTSAPTEAVPTLPQHSPPEPRWSPLLVPGPT